MNIDVTTLLSLTEFFYIDLYERLTKLSISSYILLFYYLTLYQNDALMTSIWMQLHFSGGEVNTNTIAMTVRHLCPKKY